MPETKTETGKRKMTGGRAVIEALKSEGVDTLFGIISIHMLPVYDALRTEPAMRLVIPRHEMAGGFMADAYSRTAGKPGVYLTSTGPGAANSMGAVLESWSGGAPTLQITSQIESDILDQGKGSLHEVKDQLGMFRATGAGTQRAATAGEITSAIHGAMHALRSRRPAPQVIEIPIDQQFAEDEIEIGVPRTVERPQPEAGNLDRAAEVLNKAKRPVFWIGGGVNTGGAHAEARRLADLLGGAIFTTRGGRGVVDDDHPLVVGSFFGERPARAFLEQADAILAVGTKFSWHDTAQFSLKLSGDLVRIDIDPEELQHNYDATVAIHGDAAPALTGLADRLEAMGRVPDAEYQTEIAQLRQTLLDGFKKQRPLSAELMDIIEEASPRERILVTDSTIPAYWGANQYLPHHSERGFMTARLAAIGPGLPMALGAQAADPDRPVLCMAGDGGVQLHIAELATAVQEKLNVVLLVFNNFGYGVLKFLQKRRMEGRIFGVDLHTPDFVKLADAYGVAGQLVIKPEELGPAIRRGFEAKAPYLIEIQAPFEG